MQSASPHAIREVERAISELRRGERVILIDRKGARLSVGSAEHLPGQPPVADPQHPAVQLMKLGGLLPGAVVEPAQDDNGDLTVTAEAVARYPAMLAETVVRVSEAHVPMQGCADARVIAYRPRFGREEHLAVLIGKPQELDAPHVRVHSSCVTGDVFGSLRCDCGPQLQRAVEVIAKNGGGAIIYLSQEGRGIGIANKLRAYQLQDEGLDTVEANEALGFAPDERDFAVAARMLKDLGLTRIRLLTNNPEKTATLAAHGITIEGREPIVAGQNALNAHYLDTKALKMGHQF